MRVVFQRVSRAAVTSDGVLTGEIGGGALVLCGFCPGDTEAAVRKLAQKIAGLRVFSDENDKLNLSLQETGGGLLVVSNFTLYGDCRHGRRPAFIDAARPDEAIPLYELFLRELRATGVPVEAGVFGADMHIDMTADGPITLLLEEAP